MVITVAVAPRGTAMADVMMAMPGEKEGEAKVRRS
jgi:hypothetical protein